MRYRKESTWQEIAADVEAFVSLVGHDEYMDALERLGEGLRNKGFVTETDDVRYSLELQLYNIEHIRRKSGILQDFPINLAHEGLDFLIGMGQSIPHLSSNALKKLRGDFFGGLKTDGLRSLHQEFRVACSCCLAGGDLQFVDLESKGRFDFLVEREGHQYEVEVKSLPIYSGQKILPQDADKLFIEMRKGLAGKENKSTVPIISVHLPGRLPKAREEMIEIVQTCNRVAVSKEDSITELAWVRFTGTIADAPVGKIIQAAKVDEVLSQGRVYVGNDDNKWIIRLIPVQKSSIVPNIQEALAKAAKKQTTRTRPAIIWIHIDYLDANSFLENSNDGQSFFGGLASDFFDRDNRKHVSQLVFSGGALLSHNGERTRSSFHRAVFNAPGKTDREFLFADGRTRRAADGPRKALKKIILRRGKPLLQGSLYDPNRPAST